MEKIWEHNIQELYLKLSASTSGQVEKEPKNFSGPPCGNPDCPCGSLAMFARGHGEVSVNDLVATIPLPGKRQSVGNKTKRKKK
jgi:hypothetical protein